MVHLSAVLVGLAICGVGLALFATGGHLGPLDVSQLTSGLCGGFPCPYTGGAIGGIVLIAGLGYLVRGLTAPTMPKMPVGFPPMPGYFGAPMPPGAGYPVPPSGPMTAGGPPSPPGPPATPSAGAPSPGVPVIFCSTCGGRNLADAAFCSKCGKAIAHA